ncbi:glucose dehydrogenase [Brevundimonas sp. Root1279]|nr:glucose dehydrogenase [Brevundimonas sp. Root1279]
MARIERGGGLIAFLAQALGALFVLLGAVLAIGGGYLLFLGGSFYYLVAGLGLIASGVMLFRLSLVGVWIYILIFALTLVWALWEVGLNGWALVPRVFAPAVLLLLAILVIPALVRRGGGRAVLGGVAAFFLGALISGLVVAQANRPEPPTITGAPRAAGMTEASLRDTGADWPAYGGASSARRFSPLTQINRDNVGQLERAWTFRTGDIPDEKWGAETTPLKVGDTIYLCSAMNKLIALDARNGKERWRFDPRVSKDWIPYTAACRGVAYYETADTVGAPAPVAAAGQATLPIGAAIPPPPTTLQPLPPAPCSARIIEGTLDGRLIAVDARTGRPCADFGVNGQVDIKQGMGEVVPGMVSITAAPTIVRGVVVTGHQVLDGQTNTAPSGVIQGFDARTGQLLWAWDMTRPNSAPLQPGESYTRGTPNMWTTATGDDRLGLVYLPMGNSAADYYSADRSEAENRFATSLVALDVTTGRPVWSFQTVHKDVWDYDLGSQASLIDFPTATGAVPALVLPSKQGDLYILDRRTGQPLTRVEERPAPQGGVEPQQRARTQPHSLFHTLRPAKDLTERDMWGMSPIDQMVCRIGFRKAAYDGFFTPPTSDRRSIQYPGYNGGSDWGGVAVDPQRGWIIANYNDMPNYNRLVPRAEADKKGWFPRGDPRAQGKAKPEGAGDPQAGVPYAIDVNAGWRQKFTGMLCKQPPYGGIRAIDIRTGQTVWDRPLGTARKNGPFGIPSMLPIDIGTPNNGGSVVTAGGLIFIAAATDDLIRAIDIETGKTVWSDSLPAGGQANPMVYEQDGRQYLVLMTGGHHFMETPAGDQVIAWALPAGSGA